MQAQARFVMGWIFLASVGCGTRSTLGPADAAARADAKQDSKQDGATGADLLVLPDAIEVAPGAPDLAPNRDLASWEDTSPVLAPDLAAPDVPQDQAARDAASSADARDGIVSDVTVAGDTSARDVAADRASPDVALRDVASRDASGDAIFSSIDGPLAAFCTGDYPHMVVNGIESNPVARGRMLPLSCCDAGEIQLVTATFLYPIVVSWRAEAGPSGVLPATIDLANPPTGWTVRVIVGCESTLSTCNPVPDSYTAGLQGVLHVARGSSRYDMSVCLHVQEPADSPHPIVHTLDLYAPHVSSD